MKYKTAELEGALLDAAVAKAEGMRPQIREWHGQDVCMADWAPGAPPQTVSHYQPSVNWLLGGPIIERERIEVSFREKPQEWAAWFGNDVVVPGGVHASYLTAAMRAYVTSKFGGEVEL